MSMSDRRPSLVVDVGGTLVTRERAGAFRRVLGVLAAEGRSVESPTVVAELARAVLTGADPHVAAARVATISGLADPEPVVRALVEPDGRCVLLPGALRLLEQANASGWRIIAATNATAWTPSPPRELARLITAVVASCDVGCIKQDPEFWIRLRRDHGVDPTRTLVVGDAPSADTVPASNAGFLALLLDGVRCTTATVADMLAAAGAVPGEDAAVMGGDASSWAGRRVIEVPHLQPLVERVTRLRCRIRTAVSTTRAALVRRRTEAPAVVFEDPNAAPLRLGWLLPAPDRRFAGVPPDLETAVGAAGLSLEALAPRDRRHMGALVREARDRDTRAARLADAVAHLRALAEVRDDR
jgi:FMN phosphatase YigB (HAD superfamily)